MLTLPIVLALAAAAGAQSTLPPAGRIEGVALRFDTGEPLAGVRVTLNVANRPARVPPQSTAATDDAGRFTFPNVAPGEYRVSAEGTYAEPGRQRDLVPIRFTLSEGQRVEGLRLRLMPSSAIAGRVLDEADRPQPETRVELYELVYSVTGEKYLGQWRGEAVSDASGAYRIAGIDPGEYYVVARPPKAKGGFVPVYYPGVTDPEHARPVSVLFGANLPALNVIVPTSFLYTIQVRIPRPAGVSRTDVAHFSISTQSRGSFRSALIMPAGTFGSAFDLVRDDLYESAPLPSGSYVVDVTWVAAGGGFNASVLLSPTWKPPKTRFYAVVRDRDVDAGAISFWTEPVSLTGSIRMRDGSDLPQLQRAPVTLLWGDPSGGSVSPEVLANGDIRFDHLLPGTYAIRPSGLPPDVYVASARFAGREVLDELLKIEPDSRGPLEITLDRGAGKIDGVAIDGKDKPVSFARVVLVPESGLRENPSLFATTTTNLDGTFSLPGVAPGRYVLLAWDWVRLYAYLNPDYLREFEGKGLRISVGAGTTSAKVPVIAGSR